MKVYKKVKINIYKSRKKRKKNEKEEKEKNENYILYSINIEIYLIN